MREVKSKGCGLESTTKEETQYDPNCKKQDGTFELQDSRDLVPLPYSIPPELAQPQGLDSP